jgi:hypothetical protein
MVIRKQRDGVAGVEIPFEAETVELGLDEDGDPITAQVLNFGEPRVAKPTRKLNDNDRL